MRSDQTISTVGDAFDLVNGFAFKSADFIENGIPVIKIKNVKAGEFTEQSFSYVGEKFLEKRKEKLARIGDLLISMSGNRHDGSPHTWVGKVAYFNKRGRYFINQRVGALRLKQGVEVDLKFAAYVLASMSYQEHFIAVATSSGGQANLSPTQILGAPLNLPSYAEQCEIGRLISLFDDRIELLRQTNTTLEAIAQALFKSWFVDFDPVHAKAEGRPPEAMDAATAALFPSEFEESELGPIPKGWSTGAFTEQFDFTMGQSPPGSTYNSDGIGVPFFQGCTDFGDVFPAERIYCSTPKRFARAGDVLMSVRAPVGALNIATFECSIGRGLCGVRHKSGSTGLTYLSLKACVERIVNVAGEGALFRSLSKKQLAGLTVLMPDERVILRFITIIEPIIDRMIAAARQANHLSQLRDTLLPRLISGKLRLLRATEAAEGALA